MADTVEYVGKGSGFTSVGGYWAWGAVLRDKILV